MTDWWNKNIQNRITDFTSWVGDHDQPTKSYCRKYVADKKYTSIIDCGSGVASEYYGYKNDNYEIQYTGLDSCIYLVNLNRQNGIGMVEAELEKDLPIIDNSYECVYCRGVIEHLSYYETTINEFIRIGKKEVMIGWFIKPDNSEDEVNYWVEEDLYHNKYNLEKLENFISKNDKVDNLFWTDINEKENVLHIILKDNV
jgi:ubiquinone/menaquinone biosynthesis C-methylase UbiE